MGEWFPLAAHSASVERIRDVAERRFRLGANRADCRTANGHDEGHQYGILNGRRIIIAAPDIGEGFDEVFALRKPTLRIAVPAPVFPRMPNKGARIANGFASGRPTKNPQTEPANDVVNLGRDRPVRLDYMIEQIAAASPSPRRRFQFRLR